MAWGRSNEQWNHTANLMTLIAAIHSDPDGRRPTLADYHPYLPEPEMPTATPEILKAIGLALTRRQPPGGSDGG